MCCSAVSEKGSPQVHRTETSSYPRFIPVAVAAITTVAGSLALIAIASPELLGPLNAMSKLGLPISCALAGGGVVSLVVLATVPRIVKEEIEEEVRTRSASEIVRDTVVNARKEPKRFTNLINECFEGSVLPPIGLFSDLSDVERGTIIDAVKTHCVENKRFIANILIHLKELSCMYCGCEKEISQQEIDTLLLEIIEALKSVSDVATLNVLLAAKEIVDEKIALADDQTYETNVGYAHLDDLLNTITRQFENGQLTNLPGFQSVADLRSKIDRDNQALMYVTVHP